MLITSRNRDIDGLSADDFLSLRHPDYDTERHSVAGAGFFCTTLRGERAVQEDAASISCLNDLQPELVEPTVLAAVMDGHGSPLAALVVARLLPVRTAHHLANGASGPEALRKAFIDVDIAFAEHFPTAIGGCCVVCALLTPSSVHIASVGDCRATVLSLSSTPGKYTQRRLTSDHSPLAERFRIESQGGRIVPVGDSYAVAAAGHTLGVARAIGDRLFRPSVTCMPDVFTFTPSTHDLYLLLACDGLTAAAVPAVVNAELLKMLGEGVDPAIATQVVAGGAVRAGCEDNVTALLVALPDASDAMKAGRRRRCAKAVLPDVIRGAYWEGQPKNWPQEFLVDPTILGQNSVTE